jgi:hypothetical protein
MSPRKPRCEMGTGHPVPPKSRRAQTAVLAWAFAPSSSWPASLMDQIATALASALVTDLKEHPIGELPASHRPP